MSLLSKIRFYLAVPMFGLGLLFFKIAVVIGGDGNACRMGDWFLAETADKPRPV